MYMGNLTPDTYNFSFISYSKIKYPMDRLSSICFMITTPAKRNS